MGNSIRTSLLLVGACLVAGAIARGQAKTSGESPITTDLAATYAAEESQLAPGNCGCFWFQGGGADATVTLWKGFGVAGALTADHVSNFASGMRMDKIALMAGPRYTYALRVRDTGVASRLQIFGEGLFGGVRGFHGSFPSATGLTPSAGAFALEIGGGFNAFFSHRFAVRLLEVDYVRTELPNNYSNVQNDLRLGVGVTYHLSSITKRH